MNQTKEQKPMLQKPMLWGPEVVPYTPTHYANAYLAYYNATGEDHDKARETLELENSEAWNHVEEMIEHDILAVFDHEPTSATAHYVALVAESSDGRQREAQRPIPALIAEENRQEADVVMAQNYASAKVSGTEAAVCQDIARRQELGIQKYGQTVAQNPAEFREWLQHAYEETLDQAVYLCRAIAEIDRRAEEGSEDE